MTFAEGIGAMLLPFLIFIIPFSVCVIPVYLLPMLPAKGMCEALWDLLRDARQG